MNKKKQSPKKSLHIHPRSGECIIFASHKVKKAFDNRQAARKAGARG